VHKTAPATKRLRMSEAGRAHPTTKQITRTRRVGSQRVQVINKPLVAPGREQALNWISQKTRRLPAFEVLGKAPPPRHKEAAASPFAASIGQ
jgi:hypothetical protein